MFCAACGAANPGNQPTCPDCGAGLVSRCTRCAAALPVGARFCPACGLALDIAVPPALPAAGQEPSRLSAGERKQVTVLFSDFAGFTAFSNRVDAEEVYDYMQALWARLDAVIAAHGGVTEKHIGDAIMALFGSRQAREDDPAQAVRAALAMQACVAETQSLGGQRPLQMRVGIHTGLIVVGTTGAAGEWAATGDAINLASRLEHHAPVGGVLISHDTFRHVYGLFDVQGLSPLEVKGLPEPVQTYQVLGAKPRAVAVQLRGVEGATTEMIGREAELKRLQTALQNAIAESEAQLVTVTGEAGIGKSCLLREFQKWLDLIPQRVRHFSGRASAEMTGLPFALIREVFLARFEIRESDPAAVAREKLERGVLNLLSSSGEAAGWSADDQRLHAHFIGQLLGLDFSASPFLRDVLHDAEQIRQRAFHCLSRFFAAISSGAPDATGAAANRATLLVFEDIHWSDDGSLDLIQHLARTCQGAPMMIVCLTRPALFERRPIWGEGLPAHLRFELSPLSRTESRALVAALLCRAPEIPQALRELIVGGAEGNPFFIEEIIKMLIDQKVIVPGADHWRIEPDRLAAARVPATLTAVLQARLDGLTPLERSVLQRASVLGRVFWDNAVEHLQTALETPRATAPTSAQATRETLEALAGLRRKELVLRREASAFSGAVEYLFKHELLRSVAYESLLKKHRRLHHAQAAAWLIAQSGERIGEFTGLVANHLEYAGNLTEAAEWFGRAGRQARAGYAPATAIGHYRKALALRSANALNDHVSRRQQMDWHEGLGEALGAQARFAEALEACTEFHRLAEALGDQVAQARAANGLAFLHERRGDNRASIDSAERAGQLACAAGGAGRAEHLRSLHLKGWTLYRLGDATAVLSLAEETLRLCTESGDRRGMATSFKLYGVAHLQLGHFAEADQYFTQGLELSLALGDRRNAAAMWSNLGESARLRGDFQAATGLYEKALAIARQIGHRESEIIYLSNLSGAQLGLREFAAAEAGLHRAMALISAPSHGLLAEISTFLAEAYLGQGKPAEALDTARRALTQAQASEDHLSLGCAWRTLGRAAAALKQRDGKDAALEPPTCFHESLRVFSGMNAAAEQARTLCAWAKHEIQEGQVETGRQKLDEARHIFRRLGLSPEPDLPTPADG